MFDSDTDGDDDLDLYLFYCPTPQTCRRVEQSGSATSAEQIDIAGPDAGAYEVYVHGFETDQASGGPGALFSLSTWLILDGDRPGNLVIDGPTFVSNGAREPYTARWQSLLTGNRYFGIVVHSADGAPVALTRVSIVN